MLIYMDESGFTGEDLLHLQQPVFVHVSTCLSDEECAALAKDHFSGVQGDELKHKRLGRRPNGQSRILDLPRFRGEMRAWDQALWLDVMLSSGLVAFFGSAPGGAILPSRPAH